MIEPDEVGDQIRDQLKLLLKVPRKMRLRYRSLEYICGGCGETILSVMNTHPCRVITGRGEDLDAISPLPWAEFRAANPKPTVAEVSAWYREHHVPSPPKVDPDEGVFVRIPDDFEQTATTPMHPGREDVYFLCRCNQWQIPLGAIATDLREGKRKRSWMPR